MALGSSLGITAYLALFGGIGFVFVFVNLLIGRLVRPANPSPEKLEIYECGEPTIGSSFVQFDLRYYVVALIFIVFDVEVAFLFPWATVFGKAVQLRRAVDSVAVAADAPGAAGLPSGAVLQESTAGLLQELGVRDVSSVAGGEGVASGQLLADVGHGIDQLLLLSIVAAAIFFVVLLIGFAYEWRTGALDWVRAISTRGARDETQAEAAGPRVASHEHDAALTG